jgi:hypothetical protein
MEEEFLTLKELESLIEGKKPQIEHKPVFKLQFNKIREGIKEASFQD